MRKINKIKNIAVIAKDTILKIASKKTFWLFFITLLTSCGLDFQDDTKSYIQDIGLIIFQILSKII
jgi:hypothetical protein